MSSNKVLVIAGVSLLLLAAISRFGAFNEAPNVNATINDLPRAQSATTITNDVRDVQPEAVKVIPVPSNSLSPDDQKKLDILNEVIAKGRDNDPRIDGELKSLSPALKSALKAEYQRLPKEHRNGRGFIAFLIGRALTDESDVAFLEEIVKEDPCLSFENCDTRGAVYEEAEEHSTNVTLDYPQIVASRMLKQNLPKASPHLRAKISEALSSSRF